MGVLLYTDLWVGFSVVASVLILGLAQTVVSFHGRLPAPRPRR